MSATKNRDLDDEGAGSAAGPKKHHFTPLELQKKQLDRLLEKIDKPIHIPERPNQKRTTREPKDYVKNVQGSSAGAGSGEFHVYRAGRRREYARLRNMELESKEEREQREYEEKIRAKRTADEEKTDKNRVKRQRRKQRAANNKMSKRKGDTRSSDDEEHDQEDQEDRKQSQHESVSEKQ
ncbi:hypothetical protein BC939DRAFT_483495 [Gamsiella multidivaricata]|uniref:uncharacterized protein n=1 Tax=Gamsiella multidivaricata TaxID=101098 RepID=UPI00221EE6E6|nr:uncharacterized protein BC939DRAFT_483495 [Gamsiella multidivaricata]KAG0371217.1 hypothetical protein BGZ54_008957 [Gamsiella multidivaricata]KAI7827958.1 hypothetical protein BC939DRAFT_483495 [Gamsiella multidivaricata]